ncbi:MAG: rRNA (cytosine967-C5)-methyltransferase [Actinomycetota bacterium]|nr:rRNA (cytosine967-C5)-methyltransferase [Actinomycetota bacterium]
MAVEALTLVEAGGYSNLVLPGLLRTSGLDQRDRALVTDLVYGTLRQQGRADHLLARASHRPLPELDPPVRAALRVGTYQLLSGVAPHAAVGATVGALAGWSSPASVRRAAPYANAVLRRVAELGPDWPWPAGDDPGAVAVRTSHPRWIVELLRRDLGDDAEAVLASANEPPAVTLRPNPLRTTPEALAAELAGSGRSTRSDGLTEAGRVRASGDGVQVEAGRLVPSALLVRGVGDLARLPAVAEGRATPQDQASQAVAAAIGARPGERILDLAAAPGGKATAMAEGMGDEGLVVAADLRPRRAARVRDAAVRLGLRSVQVIAADGLDLPLRGPDARTAPEAGGRAAPIGELGARPADEAAGRFDRVLLDAPCSGLGVLRRRPEARWRLDPSDIERVAALQRELLAAAVARVQPGGLVAYCVCTLTREETLDIDTWAAGAFPALTAVTGPGAPWRPHGRGALLLPTAAGTDGMFLLLLRAPAPDQLPEPVR